MKTTTRNFFAIGLSLACLAGAMGSASAAITAKAYGSGFQTMFTIINSNDSFGTYTFDADSGASFSNAVNRTGFIDNNPSGSTILGPIGIILPDSYNSFDLSVAANFTGDPVTVNFFDGVNLVGSGSVTLTNDGSPTSFAQAGFTSDVLFNRVEVIAPAGSNEYLRISSDSMNFGNAIPEPSTAGLLALTGLALLRRRRN